MSGDLTAIYGGRFDPPHLGHQQVAREVMRMPGVRRLWVLPTGLAPHKASVATDDQRAEMTRLCFEPLKGDGELRVDLREMERSRRSGAASYAFDTLKELAQELGGAERLIFVLGADQLARLPTWHRFPEVLSLCHWLALERKPDGNEKARTALQEWVASGLTRPDGDRRWAINDARTTFRLLPTAAPDLSSTRIREHLARSGTPPAGALSPAVESYLKAHRIYGMQGSSHADRQYDSRKH